MPFQRLKGLSPRQLLRLTPKFWPSAKKRQHTNPAGVIGVWAAHRRSEKTDDFSEGNMNLDVEQLTRRPLSKTRCDGSTGPTFRVYSHATDPNRISTVNGIIHQPPVPPPDEVPTQSCGVAQLGKRERVVENGVSPPTAKKRLSLSLNKRKSRTPSGSVPTSRSNSPCSSVESSGSHQQNTSSSPTPPTSPVDIKMESPKLKLLAESPLPACKNKGKRKSCSPVKIKIQSSDCEVAESKEKPADSPDERELSLSSPAKPCFSQEELVCHKPHPLDTTPPLDADSSTMEQSAESLEIYNLTVPEEMPNYHDISAWGEGRMAYSCDLTNCRPFDKFSLGHLENYSEMVSREGDMDNYLHTAERLVNHGCFFPVKKLDEVFRVMWRNGRDHEQVVKKMQFILQQDLSLRTDTSMDSSHFWYKVKRCLEALESNTDTLVACVQLNYLLGFLIKNLDANKLEPRLSLVEQLLSSKKTLHISAILDVIFALRERCVDSVTSTRAVECLLAMVCLPLLTCDPSSRSGLRTKLAREFAMRLDKLASYPSQYQLIMDIPSNYLKEKVIDFVLERNFLLPGENAAALSQTFSDDSISFAKIASIHLCREARCLNGATHNLTFFLQLLSGLIQCHVKTVTGTQPLVSLFPSSCLPHSSSEPSLSEDKVREQLFDMHRGVLLLTDRLSQDNDHFLELTEPATWFHLQLLSLITSPL